MERIKQILEKQWRITPIWVKIFAFVGIIWSMIYFISTFLIMTGRAELVMAATGFEVYVLILKGLIGAQFLLFIVHLLILMNQQIGPNLELRQKLNQAQKYLRRIHPVVGITTLIMVLAHVVWNFSRFLSFDWPWTVQIITGIAGISLIVLVALSGDGALLAPVNRRKKVILVHTILALVFLIPFLLHI